MAIRTVALLLVLVALLGAAPEAPLRPSKFAAANAALAAPRPGEPRVVFIGDSITSGWSKFGGGFLDGRTLVGRGIAGQTTAAMRARFAEDVLALKPTVVHILGGTNDIAGNGGPMTLADTEANLAAMAKSARAAGARVILGSVLPASDFPWRPGQHPAASLAALNVWIRHEATERGYTYADYYTPFVDADGGMKPGTSKDGVHPTAETYRAMAPIARAAIAAATR